MNVALATLGGAEATTPVVSKIVVQKVNNQQVVFVATKESNVFAMRRVRLGIESNGFFPVLEGLSTGERVVTEGSFLLRAEWLSHMRRIESRRENLYVLPLPQQHSYNSLSASSFASVSFMTLS